MHESRARSTGYWITTCLASLNLLIAGTAYLAGVQVVRDGFAELGYPRLRDDVVGRLQGAGRHRAAGTGFAPVCIVAV